MFVTGSYYGTVSLWKNKKLVKSITLFDSHTRVLFKNGGVFARTDKNDYVIELNLNLAIVIKFVTREKIRTMDANENYLVVGYWGDVFVDVYGRKKLNQGGYKECNYNICCQSTVGY